MGATIDSRVDAGTIDRSRRSERFTAPAITTCPAGGAPVAPLHGPARFSPDDLASSELRDLRTQWVRCSLPG
jgi:rRNA maturation protein Nop10